MIFIFLRIAARNVVANWRHGLAGILSITAAFVSLCIFSGYISEVARMYVETFEDRNMLGQLLVLPADYEASPDAVFQASAQKQAEQAFHTQKAVDFWVPFLPVTGTATNGASSMIFVGFGYDVKAGARMRAASWAWNTMAGVPLDHAKATDTSVLLGLSLGEILGCKPTTEERFISGSGGYKPVDRPFKCVNSALELSGTTIHGRANAVQANVTGLVDGAFKDIDLRYVLMPLGLAQDLHGRDDVGFYSLRLKPELGGDIAGTAKDIKAALAERGIPAKVLSWKAHKFGDTYVKSMDFLMIFRNFIVAIIVLIAGLSILNVATRNIQERTREIGTLRSLGYLPRQLTVLFLLESLFLTVAGSALGVIIAVGLSRVVNSLGILYQSGMLSQPVPFCLAMNFGVGLNSFLLIAAIGLIASYVACQRAHKMSIVACLTHT